MLFGMGIVSNRVFQRIYEKARRAEELPWHREAPPALLQRVVRKRRGSNGSRRRALDIGCGAGVYSCWLAENGHDVTGIDFNARAIEMSEQRARERSLNVAFEQADALRWSTDSKFDVILDSGCLHGFTGDDREAYRRRIKRWLDHDGDYVLVHFAKRHALDWRPMGPRRKTRGEILALFSPDFSETESEIEEARLPLPLGPVVHIRTYWLRHNRS